MKKAKVQVTNPTLFNKPEACTEEKGILTIITQGRTIRRAYLNNKIVPASIDTCSLISIVESNDPMSNRILKFGRKLEVHRLCKRSSIGSVVETEPR